MRKILYLALIATTLISCGKNGSNAKISGKLGNVTPQKVYIQELTLTGQSFTDSIDLSTSGRFKFKLNLEEPGFYKIKVGNQRGITLIVRPDDKIFISGKSDSLYQTYEVERSDESNYAKALDKRMDKTIRGIDSLNNVYRMFINNPNIKNITITLQNNYYRYIDEQRTFTMDFIQKHPGSLASIMALYQQTDDSIFVLFKKEDQKYYAMVDSLLYPKYPKASYVKALHNNLETITAQLKKEDLKKILSSLGAPAQDFSLPNQAGKNISLSSFKGKTVLLYFWASWCDSCRSHNAVILKTANKFKAKGLEVVAVSLDMNKDVWLKAIQKDKIGSWNHLSDLKYWDSSIVPLYNIENLPLSFLIDKEGIIVARSINPNGFDERLTELLK
jgi:peroxiredoxin